MPYVKKVCRYKNVEEVERVHAGRYGKGGKRENRRLPTPCLLYTSHSAFRFSAVRAW